jgi:predicted RNA-binding protein YlqC (UPF0109 family)
MAVDPAQSDPYREFVEFVARMLARFPDEVVVSESTDGNTTVYHLKLNSDDVGRVIGREGRIIRAIRSLLRAGAVRQGTRVALEIE